MALSLVGWPTLNLLGGSSEELVELRGPLGGAVVRPVYCEAPPPLLELTIDEFGPEVPAAIELSVLVSVVWESAFR